MAIWAGSKYAVLCAMPPNALLKPLSCLFRSSEVREEDLKRSVEKLAEALEKKSKEVEKLAELKNDEITALKTDLVSF